MRIRQEAAAERDLPEAIAITGSLQDELHAALDVLLRRAQEAGAVRPEITTPDIIILLKGLLQSINDTPLAQQAKPWLTGCSPMPRPASRRSRRSSASALPRL